MNCKKSILCCVLLLVGTSIQAADKVAITVQNPLPGSREFEMIQVDAQKLKAKLGTESLVVTDADGKEIPSQLTYDGQVIFQASVGGKSKSTYYAVAGTPTQYEKRVTNYIIKQKK